MDVKEIVESITKLEQEKEKLLGKVKCMEIEAKEDKKLLKIVIDQKEEIEQRLKKALSAILVSAKEGLTTPEVEKEETKK